MHTSPSIPANTYRTHTCEALRKNDIGNTTLLSGWVHRKRDHGGLLFVDVRDHYGITQCVFETDHPQFQEIEDLRVESVVTIEGEVVARPEDTLNPKLPTGDVEVRVKTMTVQSEADMLPLQVFGDEDFPEATRLKYRFLDLRREQVHNHIVLRSQVISSLRRRMTELGFLEIQTPILTASSPEGARDFLVPSRLHPGKFYALPQAPQMFKQLLMVGGFDRYFQIAPCFRDEDARADRSPGEFYQLDLEMAFVEQEDIFSTLEPVLHGIFEEFAEGRTVTDTPFPRLTYHEAMLTYGCDKPDLRNPLTACDVTEIFDGSGFSLFANAIKKGSIVRAIGVPGVADRARSFFDGMNDWARSEGAPGLGYIVFSPEEGGPGIGKGPIAKQLSEDQQKALQDAGGVGPGDAMFFVCNTQPDAEKLVAKTIAKLGQDLDLLEKNAFRFCWIVDYPMYERDELTGKIDFSHNPFSMPQGGLKALENQDPLDIKAYQYDIVCNGVELSSGAIRNHLPDVMYKAFEIAGYSKQDVETEFGGMLRAFKFGAPPHGGSAPGVDRMVMLLADTENIREVVAFPMNQQAEDLLMDAPSEADPNHLRELHIKVHLPPKEKPKEKKDDSSKTATQLELETLPKAAN